MYAIDKYASAFGRRPAEAHTAKPPAATREDQLAAVGAAAVAAYRQRRSDIMALPEAIGRKALAEKLAEGDLALDDVQAELAAAPTDAQAKADAIVKRVVANHRGEPPPGHEPTATAKRVISRLRGT